MTDGIAICYKEKIKDVMLWMHVVLPKWMINMLCCYFATERCSGGMGRESPYKAETLTLIRNYPTQFSATSFYNTKAAYVYKSSR